MNDFLLSNTCTLQLTLSSDAIHLKSSESVQLSKGSFVGSSNLNSLTIQLSNEDSIRIKTSVYLCKSASSCFISCTSLFANDTKTTNSITGATFQIHILPTELLPCNEFLPDVTAPNLLSFSVNFNLREISFSFNKPVDSQRLNSSALTLGTVFNRDFNTTSHFK